MAAPLHYAIISIRRLQLSRCTPHDPPGTHWFEQTPAMVAGLAARRWSLRDLLT